MSTPRLEPWRGRLIVVEGGEGSGKTTQAALLARRLGAELTREPGGTPLGERIRALLLDPELAPVAPRAELLLAVSSRAQHVALVVEPALAGGADVVCDRFSGSTLAYQGYGRRLPLGEVAEACAIAAGGLAADLSVLRDDEPETAARRRHVPPDRIESEDGGFHERVRDGFRALAAADPVSWAVVDGNGTPDEVERLVLAAVTERLGARAAR